MIKDLESKLEDIKKQYKEVQDKLSDVNISANERIQFSKKFSKLEQIISIKSYIDKTEKTLDDTKSLLEGNIETEIIEMAKSDIIDLDFLSISSFYYFSNIVHI